MDAIVNHPCIALGHTPISEDKPAGTSVRYETNFEQLEAELAKQESLSAASVSWPEVVKLASEILKSHSKDLLVGVYLCHALVETEGYTGLTVGLTIINKMISQYWQDLFPPVKRLRARKTAMQWLAEKTGRYVEAHSPANQDFDAVLEAAKLIREIDGALADSMGDGAPVLSDLTRPLKRYKGSIQQQKAQGTSVSKTPETAKSPSPSPQKTVHAPPVPKSAAPSSAAVPQAIQVDSEGDARKGLRQIQENLRKLASFLLQAKVTDPRPYRFSRMSAWLIIDQLPPQKDGVTQVTPPAMDRRKQLEGLFSQGEHVNFIQGIEQTLARAPFWLDGHRMTAQALTAIGESGDAAKKNVIGEMAAFLTRLPGVQDLKFLDGTAFADNQTQLWLSTEVLIASEGGSGGTPANAGLTPETASWMDTLPEAKKMAANGKLNEAVDLFDQGISTAPDFRQKFCWRRTMADFLIQTGKIKVAVQLLEQLADEAEQFQLDRWEPRLSAVVYRLLSVAYLKLQGKDQDGVDLKNRSARNYARLCWIDPAMALTIE